jgi:hypothetical protein
VGDQIFVKRLLISPRRVPICLKERQYSTFWKHPKIIFADFTPDPTPFHFPSRVVERINLHISSILIARSLLSKYWTNCIAGYLFAGGISDTRPNTVIQTGDDSRRSEPAIGVDLLDTSIPDIGHLDIALCTSKST